MFDVGFSEMIVIAVVALVVIGPEKLPRVARTVGALMGRMQRYVNDVKADINREIELDELKKMHTSVKEAADSIHTSVKDAVSSFEAHGQEMNAAFSGETSTALGSESSATQTRAPDAPMTDAELSAAIEEAQSQAVLAAPEPAASAEVPAPVPVAQASLALEPEPVSAVAPDPHATTAPAKPAA